MLIRNCLLTLSLGCVAASSLLAADKDGSSSQNAITRRGGAKCTQQTPPAPSRACRIGTWCARLVVDAAATGIMGGVYNQCKSDYGTLPIVEGSNYLTNVGDECDDAAIATIGLGGLAVCADVVGLCGAILGCEAMERAACNVSFGFEAAAFCTSVVAVSGIADADFRYPGETPALTDGIDAVRRWDAFPMAGFGATALAGVISRLKACCASKASCPQQQSPGSKGVGSGSKDGSKCLSRADARADAIIDVDGITTGTEL